MTLAEAVQEQAKVVTALMFSEGQHWMKLIAGVGIAAENGDYTLRVLLTVGDPFGLIEATVSALKLVIKCEYVITGGFVALNGPAVAAPGSRIARGRNGSGTLGAVVRDVNGNLNLLTCAHVLFGSGDIQAGIDGPSQTTIATGDTVKILCPFDDERIAADAGIAKLVDPAAITPRFPTRAVTNTAPGAPAANTPIEHFGANGHSEGVVSLVNATLEVKIGNGYHTFESCALTADNFAQPGDSGSIAINKATHSAVGIVFAKASFNGSFHVALCSIEAALNAGRLTLVLE